MSYARSKVQGEDIRQSLMARVKSEVLEALREKELGLYPGRQSLPRGGYPSKFRALTVQSNKPEGVMLISAQLQQIEIRSQVAKVSQ